MLLLPLLLGIAASRPAAWHLVLAGAALTGYLASASIQAWARAGRPVEHRLPILVYGGAFGALGSTLVVAFPPLLTILVVAVPAAVVVFGGARPATRRDLVNSLAQVAQAVVLVPAAAYVSGAFDAGRAAAGTAVAAAYLIGTVLVVRSVLRERGNHAFATISIGWHLAVTVAALAYLPVAYSATGLVLAGRAIVLPVLQRRWAGGRHALRPIHVGIVEIAASMAVVAVSFAVQI